MKRLLILLVLLCLSTAIFAEGLVFDEPIPLADHPNIRMTNYCRNFANGNILLVYNQMHLGEAKAHIQLLNPEYQKLWDTPILVQDLVALDTRQDNSFSLIRKNNIPNPELFLDTYDQAGALIPALSNIGFTFINDTPPLLYSDASGGLNILSYKSYRLEHIYIDASGTPTNKILLSNATRRYEPGFAFTNDQGFLLASSRVNGFQFIKVNANHEVAWIKEYPRDQQVKTPHLRALADGTFYFIWEESSLVNVQKVAANGNLLWENPWQSAASMKSTIEAAAVAETGNLVLHYHQQTNNYDGVPFYHCFDIINPAGSSIESYESSMPANLTSYFNRTFNANIMFDGSGGWFYIAHAQSAIYVQHFDGSQSDWQEPLRLSALYGEPGLSLTRFVGENLEILYLAMSKPEADPITSYCSISLQKIDVAGNLLYPDAGCEIMGGKNTTVSNVKYLGLANGCLFAIWRESSARMLFYQVMKPNGEKYYREPQSFVITNSGEYMVFETDAGEILVVGGYTNQKYLQKINLQTGSQWGYEDIPIPVGFYNYHQGALYVGRVVQNEVYVQRYVDGYPAWKGDGIVVGILREDYLGNSVIVSGMKDNCIIWSQSEGNLRHMSFVNFFYENGSTKYAPEEAPILAELFGDYVGCSPKEIYRYDNGWTVLTNMIKWEWEQQGHSDPGGWVLAGIPHYVILDEEGLPLYSPIASRFSPSFIYNNTIYGINDFLHTIVIYDLIQDTTSIITVPHTQTTNQILLADGRLLWYGKNTTQYMLHFPYHYGSIDREGNIDIPEESYVSGLDCNALVQTDYGVYFSLGKYNLASNIQYFEIAPWQEGAGNHTPALSLNLRNYPNPFNPSTNIVFTLPEAGLTTLEIFNLKGQKVDTILDEYQPQGKMIKVWQGVDKHGKKLPSGVYFCRLKSGKYEQVKKMLLMK